MEDLTQSGHISLFSSGTIASNILLCVLHRSCESENTEASTGRETAVWSCRSSAGCSAVSASSASIFNFIIAIQLLWLKYFEMESICSQVATRHASTVLCVANRYWLGRREHQKRSSAANSRTQSILLCSTINGALEVAKLFGKL